MEDLEKIVIFGKTENAKPGKFYHIKTLEDLIDKLGMPLEETVGTHLAVQTLLYNFSVMYYPVLEEGSSKRCYDEGMKKLVKRKDSDQVAAIVMPGLGTKTVVDQALDFCTEKKCLLILNEQDYYDFLTEEQELEEGESEYETDEDSEYILEIEDQNEESEENYESEQEDEDDGSAEGDSNEDFES